jgi:flagellar biogenesis protein FliO
MLCSIDLEANTHPYQDPRELFFCFHKKHLLQLMVRLSFVLSIIFDFNYFEKKIKNMKYE